jgi:hypothetical protein
MGPIVCPEATLTSYQSTLRNILEERRSKEYFCFPPRIITYIYLKWRDIVISTAVLHGSCVLVLSDFNQTRFDRQI